MEQIPLAKIIAAIVTAILIGMSRSKNADVADMGRNIGLALLGIGLIVFLLLKLSGDI